MYKPASIPSSFTLVHPPYQDSPFTRPVHTMAALPCCCCCHLTKQPDDSYAPSCFARTCFAPMFGAKTLPMPEMPETGTASGKILVVGTSKSKLACTNGKVFSTGHNISETLFPMFYLAHAGYTFDIATGDGKPFAFEEWSWAGPKANKNESELRGVLEANDAGFMKPLTTEAALANLKSGAYVAAFFPGGHGTMIEMHDPEHDKGSISQILAYLLEKAMPTITLCHGPNVLRAAPAGTYHRLRPGATPSTASLTRSTSRTQGRATRLAC